MCFETKSLFSLDSFLPLSCCHFINMSLITKSWSALLWIRYFHKKVVIVAQMEERRHRGIGSLGLLKSEPSQGPLNIWTEHSNCQIHSRGDSKTLIVLLIPNIFLIRWTESFAFSELYSNQPKSEIYPKMPMFEQLKKQVPVNSKHFLTPH